MPLTQLDAGELQPPLHNSLSKPRFSLVEGQP
jgi:hypothetical protein